MNIFDYLTWRGDVPFSADPFNEVDGLVLSQLAYTDFGAIVPAEGSVPLSEAAPLYFERDPREAILARPGMTAPSPLLMEEMIRGARFQEVVLMNYIDVLDKDNTEQMSAITYRLPDDTSFIAYRGTDSTLVGWKEDMALSYAPATAGQQRAVAYLQAVGARCPGDLRVGGHSKGGHFAVYASAFCGEEIQKRIREIYSYDGPGFRDDFLRDENYSRILHRIRHLVPEAAFFGMMMSSFSAAQVVQSNATGVWQHDGLSWQVERNRFTPGELNEMALLIDRTMDSWLDQMKDEEKSSFFETIFTILESTGQDSFQDLSNQKLKTTEAMLNSMAGLPKEKRKELLSFLKELVIIGGRNVVQHHREKQKG